MGGCVAGCVGGKIIPRIRLTSAKDLVEVEASACRGSHCGRAECITCNQEAEDIRVVHKISFCEIHLKHYIF